MLPGVKRTVPAAQTLPQPSLGGSRLLLSTARSWQLHPSLRGRAALGIPGGGGISTHLRPGERLPAAPAARRVPSRERAGDPAPHRLPYPSHLTRLPPEPSQAVTGDEAELGSDPSRSGQSSVSTGYVSHCQIPDHKSP
ncbi:uncharacterized protein LOC144377184 [Ictidomys tridecemlineatus]